MTAFQISIGRRLAPLSRPRLVGVSSLVLPDPQILSFSEIPSNNLPLATNISPAFFYKDWCITHISIPSVIRINCEGIFESLPHIEIGGNLFNILLPVGFRGRQYLQETNGQEANLNKNLGRKKRSEFGKDFEELKTQYQPSSHKPPKPSIDFFNLILPLLLPPLRLNSKESKLLPFPLYKFQWIGVDKLIEHPNFLLADEMGTGKTVMTCVAMKVLFQQAKVKKALIICPVSVVRVWIEHFRDWVPELRVISIRGTAEERGLLWSYPTHIHVVSYDTFRSDLDGQVLKDKIDGSYDLVVIDEAQAIKNESSKRHRALRKLHCHYRWALTGTPIENKIDELIALFNFLVPKLYPPKAAKVLSEDEVRNKAAPFLLRRLKKDVLKDLPPKIRQPIWLDLDTYQQEAYARELGLRREALKALGTGVSRVHVFNAIQALKQICNFAPNKYASPKLDALLDILEEVKNNNTKVVVFSQYLKEGLEKIHKTIGNRVGISKLSGDMSQSERDKVVVGFQNDPQQVILLASLRAGGVGLTLTEASYVVHFDHWWNPAVMRQAEDRVHRKGQKAKSVHIYEFWMADTIEERIYLLLEEKGILIGRIIDSLAKPEEIEGKISLNDLLSIFDLQQNADGKIMDAKPQKAYYKSATLDQIQVSQLTLEEIQNRIFALTPTEFEILVMDVIRRIGYPNIEHTGKSSDGGVDVLAWKNTGNGIEKAHIQCKRYKHNIGVKEVRDLYGVVSAQNPDDIGILVTSSDYTNQCREFAARTKGRILLINGMELAREIQSKGINI